MSSREKILKNIRAKNQIQIDRIDLNYKLTEYKDKKQAFIEALQRAGGEIIDNTEGFDIVLKAEFAIAENGACFINNQADRKAYSYYESIAIELDSTKIVSNMQEAMKLVDIEDFAIFLSGPSKTADIEQSLVIGAHGAKKLGVKFI
jgi:L-lactate dehydrogenase complex protein LldG